MPIPIDRRSFLSAAGAASLLGQSKPLNDFRFAIMGDRTGTPLPQIYSRIWREVRLLGPDLAISVGDAIVGLKDDTAVKEWDEMRELWNSNRDFPFYSTPGNHDIWSPASERLYTEKTGKPPRYSVVHQNTLFIVLDNSRTEDLGPAELSFCEQELKKYINCKPKFVFFHRPFWLIPIRVGNGDFSFHRLMKQYGVDYVVSGHGHQLVHLEREGVHYLEVGSSGGSIERGLRLGQGFRDGWFYHSVWARVRGNSVSLTVKEIGAPWGIGRMFRLDDWDATGPTFDPGDPALLDKPVL